MTAPAGTPAGTGEAGAENAIDAPATGDDKLGDGGIKALESERAARTAADKALKAANAKIKEFEDAGKSEAEKITADRDGQKTRADAAEMRLLKLEIGLEKGLSAKQAARLVGSNKAEIEADADELLEAFGGTKTDAKAAPADGKPREALKPSGGGDPGNHPAETDPRKLAALIPRS